MPEHAFDLDRILSLCLQAIETEDWSVEDCLARYPNHRQDLEPALRIALSLRQAQALRPSYTFRQNASSRLQARLENSARPPVKRAVPTRTPGRLFGWRLSPLGALAVLLLLFTASLGSVAYAADEAGPGDTLYGVDLAVESLRLRLASSDEALARLYVQFAEERLEEAHSGVGEDDVDTAMHAYDDTIAVLQDLLAGGTLSPEEEDAVRQTTESLLAIQSPTEGDENGEIEPQEDEDSGGESNDNGEDEGEEDDNDGSGGSEEIEGEEDDNSGSGGSEDDGEGDDSSGSDGGDEDDDGEDDSSGSDGGDEDDGGGEDDNSGSGGSEDDGDGDDNSGSDGGGDEAEEDDNSGSDGSGDDKDDDDDKKDKKDKDDD